MASRKSGVGKFLAGWFFGGIFAILFLAALIVWAYFYMPVRSVENIIGKEIVKGDEAKSLTIQKALTLVSEIVGGKSEKSIEGLADMFNIKLSNILEVSGSGDAVTYKYKGLDVTSVIKGKISELSSNAQTVVNNLTLQSISSIFGVVLPEMPIISDPAILATPISQIGDAIQNRISTYTLRQFAEDFEITNLTNQSLLKEILDIPFSGIGNALSSLMVGDVFLTPNTDLSDYTFEVASVIKIVEVDGEESQEVVPSASWQDLFSLVDGTFKFNTDENNYKVNIYAKKGAENLPIVIIKEAGKLMTATFDGDKIVIYKNQLNLKDFALEKDDENSGVLGNLYSVKIQDLGSEISDSLSTLKIVDLIDIDEDDFILNALVDENTTLATLQTRIANLKLGDLFTGSSNKMLAALSDCKISELETGVSNLLLKDVIEITETSNSILIALQNSKITEIGSSIGGLTVAQIFPAPAPEEADTRHIIIQKLAASGVSIFSIGSQLDTVIDDLSLSELLDADFNSGFFSLLYVGEGDDKVTGGNIKMSDFEEAIENASKDLFNKSLFDLKTLGFITEGDIPATDLEKPLFWDSQGRQIGQLSIIELIEYIVSLYQEP